MTFDDEFTQTFCVVDAAIHTTLVNYGKGRLLEEWAQVDMGANSLVRALTESQLIDKDNSAADWLTAFQKGRPNGYLMTAFRTLSDYAGPGRHLIVKALRNHLEAGSFETVLDVIQVEISQREQQRQAEEADKEPPQQTVETEEKKEPTREHNPPGDHDAIMADGDTDEKKPTVQSYFRELGKNPKARKRSRKTKPKANPSVPTKDDQPPQSKPEMNTWWPPLPPDPG